jgi:hypothetical protein
MRAIHRVGFLGVLAGCAGPPGNGVTSWEAGASLAPADAGLGSASGEGAIDLRMTWLTDWTDVDVLHYTLDCVVTSSNNSLSVVRMGDITTFGKEITEYVITQVPSGDCCGLTLSGVHADAMCNVGVDGSSTGCFAVHAGATTDLSVWVGSGDLLCNPVFSDCPVIQSLGVIGDAGDVSDAGTVVMNAIGMTVPLEATAVGPNPGALAYAWSSSNVAVASVSVANEADSGESAMDSFTCTAAGTTTITVVVSDGPTVDGGGCPPYLSTMNFTLVCGIASSGDAAAFGDVAQSDAVGTEDATRPGD